MSSKIIASTTAGTALNMSADTTGILELQTGSTPTTAITIDASQNVGIGTSSPTSSLVVAGAAQSTPTVNGVHLGIQSGYATMEMVGTSGTGSLIDFTQSGTDSKGRILYDNTNNFFTFATNNTEWMRITSTGNLLFNSGYGTPATAYGCRAWVNFNGTGTVAIRGSGNVSSIGDNGTGDYTINFTNAMPDTNYAVTGTSVNQDSFINPTVYSTSTGGAAATMTTTAVRVVTRTSTTNYDVWGVLISIFR